MTPLETAAGAAGPVSAIGGGFMRSRTTRDRGDALGVPGWAFYVAGRGGVLGPCHASVVSAAFAFFPHDWFAEQWDAATAVLEPGDAVHAYLECCHEWGRRRLAGFDRCGRLTELGRRVAEAADPAALPLFAGWRALPVPDDPFAAAAQTMNVLREHRGGVHAVAVLGEGLTPLESIVAGPGGEANAAFFSWAPPYPAAEPLRARRAAIESHTDRLAAPAYATLDDGERKELLDLLTVAMGVAFTRR